MSPPTPVSAPRALPPQVDFAITEPTQAIRQLVETERAAAIAGDLPTLAQLWAPASRIVDGRGTPDPGDDYIWAGHAAVLDRYVVAVFPNPPPPLTLPPELDIQVTGAEATLRNGEDRWRFIRQAGRWWIAELVYSQPDPA
jgi:hypothetical protein